MTRIIALCLMLFATPAFADMAPVNTFGGIGGQGWSGILCSGQTATGVACTGSSGDEIVADFRKSRTIIFYSNQSTASTYTCDIYTSDNGHDADSGVGQDRSTISLSNAQEAIVLDGALAFTWAKCSSIPSGAVTITFMAVY